MKTLTALFIVALYLAVIDLGSAEQSEHEHHKQIRHRPKRQYLGDYGYHPAWYRPHYPEDRRDDRSQQDLLPHIYRLLEEISDLVRRPPPPPPPPQPIYIPYPVQYPCQRCNCPTLQKPNVTSRFPEMEDSNQNWGYDDSNEPEDDFNNNRPINFDPIAAPGATSRPPPAVEHGSSQASVNSQQGKVSSNTRRPKRCDAMVLSCCDPSQARQQQRACFVSGNCASYFDKRDVCSKQFVQEVLDTFASAYAPTQ
ncbi:uncharacterized protein LOC134649496 [Cydia amplana]|uniref:uncharacterized protein LOC134649496 n=1 Tax=Cydia amplana TaxID=1869771 RepID=UPI002FE6BB22